MGTRSQPSRAINDGGPSYTLWGQSRRSADVFFPSLIEKMFAPAGEVLVMLLRLTFVLVLAQGLGVFEKSPRLIVHRSPLDDSIALINQPLVLRYFMVNIGDAVAKDVLMMDNWPPQYFTPGEGMNADGSLTFRIEP